MSNDTNSTDTSSSSTPPAEKTSKKPKLDFVFIAGILVGLIMTGFGFFLQSSESSSARLIMVCGLGVVLGAFGSTATIKYKAYVVGGSAAIALVLGYFLQYLDNSEFDEFVLVQVVGVPEGTRLEIFSDRNFYGAELDRAYEFLVMRQHLRSRYLGAVLTLPPEGSETEGDILELNCIKKHELLPFFENKATVFWSYDNENQALFNDQGAKITRQGSCRPIRNEASNGSAEGAKKTIIGTMQKLLNVGYAYAASPNDIKRYSRQLNSRSSLKRRQARRELSTLGTTSVKPLLDIYINAQKSERTRVGILISLGRMLNRNLKERQAVSNLIMIEHRRQLLKDTISKNRSLRNYAAEFLATLGDPRMVQPALDLILNGKLNESDINSLLIAIKGSIGKMAPEGRVIADERMKTVRARVGPKTQILIDQIIFTTRKDITKKYWVVVGAFKNQKTAKRFANIVNNIDNNNKAFVGDPLPNLPFYRVLVGKYSPRVEAEKLRNKISRNKQIRGAFLVDYPYQR